ncbi:MAG: HIT family protein [Phycisphaerales bacterium]
MQHTNLWAPWRMAYLRELDRRAHDDGAATAIDAASASSFLQEYWLNAERDNQQHVIARNEHGMILLNRYPYANGHLLVALGDARPRLLDYEPPQRAAFWLLVELAADLMERALNPQGINLGINQGEAAGAGVAGHLHAHLVPRWNGDTNFMAAVAAVRVIPDSLEAMAEMYRSHMPGP